MTIKLTQQTIDLFTEMMCSPEKKRIQIKPLKEVFIESEELTPNDKLYKQYVEYLCGRQLPKVIFYIVMENVFGHTVVNYNRDENGKIISSDAGYFLKFNEKFNEETK